MNELCLSGWVYRVIKESISEKKKKKLQKKLFLLVFILYKMYVK